MTKTYTISDDLKAITCHICQLTSHHPKDVAERYCGQCNVFHDDIAKRMERMTFVLKVDVDLPQATIDRIQQGVAPVVEIHGVMAIRSRVRGEVDEDLWRGPVEASLIGVLGP